MRQFRKHCARTRPVIQLITKGKDKHVVAVMTYVRLGVQGTGMEAADLPNTVEVANVKRVVAEGN